MTQLNFENTEVWGFRHAIRGMRNPMNSHEKSDSDFEDGRCRLGENDLGLAQRLVRAGNEHRKFMRQIFVSVDITAPLYWWNEFDTYKVGTTANSTSKMHKLMSKPFELKDFSAKYPGYEPLPRGMTDKDLDIKLKSAKFMRDCDVPYQHGFMTVIRLLNNLRDRWLTLEDDAEKKKVWNMVIRLLPESYKQTRTVTMNYENVCSIVKQRENHKLNEWSGKEDPEAPNFISWARTLPCADELIFLKD